MVRPFHDGRLSFGRPRRSAGTVARAALGDGLASCRAARAAAVCARCCVREHVSRGAGFGHTTGLSYPTMSVICEQAPGIAGQHTGTAAWVKPCPNFYVSLLPQTGTRDARIRLNQGAARAVALPCARAHRSARYDRARTMIGRHEVVQPLHFDITSYRLRFRVSRWSQAFRIGYFTQHLLNSPDNRHDGLQTARGYSLTTIPISMHKQNDLYIHLLVIN